MPLDISVNTNYINTDTEISTGIAAAVFPIAAARISAAVFFNFIFKSPFISFAEIISHASESV